MKNKIIALLACLFILASFQIHASKRLTEHELLVHKLSQSSNFINLISSLEKTVEKIHLNRLSSSFSLTNTEILSWQSEEQIRNANYLDRYLYARSLGYESWDNLLNEDAKMKELTKAVALEFPELKNETKESLQSTFEEAIYFVQSKVAKDQAKLKECVDNAAHIHSRCLMSHSPSWVKTVVFATTGACVAAGIALVAALAIWIDFGTGGTTTVIATIALANSVGAISGGCAAVAGKAFGISNPISTGQRNTCNADLRIAIEECDIKFGK
ncbi:MAG: hypothetical protein ACK4LB_03265 [Spirosomataceae bacterium]